MTSGRVSFSLTFSLLLAPLLLARSPAAASESFFPKNNLRYPVTMHEANTLSQARFNALIDRASGIYSPVVTARGGVLRIDRNWSTAEVNAYAERQGRTYVVAMFGGLARHPLMTEDGFSLVLCHELGHHLGGAPKYPELLPEGVKMANEGQADYFGSMKCMRRLQERDDNAKIVAALGVPKAVAAQCVKQFPNANESLICQRTAMAGLVLSTVLADVTNKDAGRVIFKTPAFATPDKKVVAKTYDPHSDPQCRLDTYSAGALCAREVGDEFSDTTSIDGACNAEKGDKVGARPACWYNAKKYSKASR